MSAAASAIQIGRVSTDKALPLKAFLAMIGRAFHSGEAAYRRSAEPHRGAGNPDHSFRTRAGMESDAVVKRLYDAWLV
jgi:hypothetical protein